MKLEFIGHACVLAEVAGTRLLCDPWWQGPCFGAQWWIYPPPDVKQVEGAKVDYVYISHGHHDHLHLATLRSLEPGFRIVVSSRLPLAASLRSEGFDVIEIGPEAVYELAPGAQCRIWPTHGDDTLFVLAAGGETFVNANDALHAAPAEVRKQFAARLRDTFGRIDYFFCGYGTASHFPNCYVIPDKRNGDTAARRQHVFNERWVDLVHAVEPEYAFPFAADVVLLEDDLFWANEPVHNTERPTALFRSTHPDSPTKVVDIAPGFAIENHRIVRAVLRSPLDADALRREYAAQIARANTYGPVRREVIEEILGLLERNIGKLRDYLAAFPGDYRCLLRFRACTEGIEVRKSGPDVTARLVPADAGLEPYDVILTTRAHYVRSSLTTEYGYEILWVGSGGVFEYRSRRDVPRNVHRELIALTRNYEYAEVPVRVAPGPLHGLKQVAKRLLGRQEQDLYDLDAWTVYRTA